MKHKIIKPKLDRSVYLQNREIDWGIESITYNEIVSNLNMYSTNDNKAKNVIIKDIYDERNPHKGQVLRKFNWLVRFFLKSSLEEMYALGFQRGFKNGALAMEIEYSLHEDILNNKTNNTLS